MPTTNAKETLDEAQSAVMSFLRGAPMEDWFWALVTFVIGVLFVRALGFFIRAFATRVFAEKHAPIVLKIGRVLAYTFVTLMALRRAGFDISVLLGAAGILTVALGFASQTSASNIISGLFLVGERPFVVGDIVQVDRVVGIVESVDFVSVKLRTFDNLYARIPNEMLFKSTIVNHTHYAIRRIDIEFPLAPEVDIQRILDRMIERVRDIPTALDEPEINPMLTGFQPAGVQVRFCVWTTSDNFRDTRTLVCHALIQALRDEEMLLPGDRRQLLFGATSALQQSLHAPDGIAPSPFAPILGSRS